MGRPSLISRNSFVRIPRRPAPAMSRGRNIVACRPNSPRACSQKPLRFDLASAIRSDRTLRMAGIDRGVIGPAVGHVGGKKYHPPRRRGRHLLQQASGAIDVDIGKPRVPIVMGYAGVKLTGCKVIDHIVGSEMEFRKITIPPNVASYKIDGAVCRRRLRQIEYDDFLASPNEGGGHVRSGETRSPRDDVPHRTMPSGSRKPRRRKSTRCRQAASAGSPRRAARN